MRSGKRLGQALALAMLAAAFVESASGEDVEKKFRLGLSVGSFNGQDEVTSDSANVLTLVDDLLFIEERYVDPRNDSAVFGRLDIQPGIETTLSGQYAVSKMFLVEASVGYQKTDVGDIEVQAQFDGVDVPDTERFQFSVFRVPAGELERIPVRLTALARFRPRASFNPYVGGGLGYTVVGFEPTDEFNALSRNLDNSRGGLALLSSALFGTASLSPAPDDTVVDLRGAEVDAKDTFEWHFSGGAELSFLRHWVAFLDVRVSFSSRSLAFKFNDAEDVGVAVPQLTDFIDSEAASRVFGAMDITDGGLIDGGSLVPDTANGAPPTTDCSVSPEDCVFEPILDGEVDTGYYYVQGGSVDFGGLSVALGVRYTF